MSDLCLTNPLDIIEAENISINNWVRKATLLFTEESLPDLQWQNESKHRLQRKERHVQLFN